jgi:hypothetical protein
MLTNPYFNNYGSLAEQRVIEDLIVESIKVMGFQAYYLPNDNDDARDLLYGEDPVKKFKDAFPLEMYLSNSMEYLGEKEFFSKFGLEIKNNVQVILSKRSFSLRVPQNTFTRPREGDLIYVPFLNGTGELFEIKFTNQTKDFFMLGRQVPYFYELELEKFKYSQEIIQSGVADIDAIVTDSAYTLHLNIDTRLLTTYSSNSWSSAIYNAGFININTTSPKLVSLLNSLQVGDSYSYVIGVNTITQPVTSITVAGSLYRIQTSNAISGTVTAFTAPLLGGNGVNYNKGELVYQSADTTQANATTVAYVSSWLPSTGILSVTNIAGEFEPAVYIYGASSNAVYALANFDPLNSPAKKEQYDNEYIQSSANSIIDFSETNPFGSI